MFYEDTSEDTELTAASRALLTDWSGFAPYSDRLRRILLRNVLSEQVPHAQARAALFIATDSVPVDFIEDHHTALLEGTTFRSYVGATALDAALQPYYGNVLPAMDEVAAASGAIAAKDYWVGMFNTANARGRVSVVSQVICWMSSLITGADNDLFGSATQAIASNMQYDIAAPQISDKESAALMRAYTDFRATPTAE